MDMQNRHGHAAWTWTRSTDLVMQHGLVHAAWIWTMDIHGCLNADKKLSPASLVFRQLSNLSPASVFRHRGQSGTATPSLRMH
jgi:hypothetical protein